MTTKRVLVVDDDPEIREIVQGCLEDIAGWLVISSASGQDGLVIAATEQPDAIVLDVIMPQMDGLLFLRQLRSNPLTHSIPVVFLTVRVELTDPRRIRALNVSGTITKPFDPLSLSTKIAKFLGWQMQEVCS